MIIDSNSSRPEIQYPTTWQYKVIGTNLDEMIAAVEDAAGSLEHEITPSNISEGSKYYSVNLSVVVTSEAVRDIIYKKLSSNEHIKMVM
jgi:putative lipoic acid-binding regulatory protein